MATAPLPLQPPVNAPVAADQDMTQAWLGHQQEVADAINANTQAIADAVAAIADAGTGVTDGSNAAAGKVGEYLSADVGPTPLPNSVLMDVGGLSLPAGDWDVWGAVLFAASGTNMVVAQAWVNTVAATAPASLGRTSLLMQTGQLGNGLRLPTGTLRVSLAAPGTAYLGAYAGFAGGGAVTGTGTIAARRAR